MATPDSATDEFVARCDAERTAVDNRLVELIDTLAAEHEGMHEAISYALLGGGKRLRPILCLWSHDLVGGSRRDVALDTACAIECIHTYSLIHDDLPCMDDDDLRRGRPSTHKKFGEAIAVLAGDALLTLAFQIVASMPARLGGGRSVVVEDALEITAILASAAGTGGLITGQALDLASQAGAGTLDDVGRIHKNKTARLIAASMEAGSVAGGAGDQTRKRIREAGMLAGAAFQIVDDVLDCVTDRETLGKTPGKDAQENKLTYPAVVGLEAARVEAAALIAAAKTALPDGTDGPMIHAVFDFIVERGA
ncbi:MAG: polyprenyl synthetase family protein [Candidatus Krumholzibacteria bacterium]|nr:polyprenyl synthetase family protein [Candidatus Krumholzibacteria bacterium]